MNFQLGVLYMSFMFFSKQFQTRQIKEAVAIMQESEQDDVSQVLMPVPKGEENVSLRNFLTYTSKYQVCSKYFEPWLYEIDRSLPRYLLRRVSGININTSIDVPVLILIP